MAKYILGIDEGTTSARAFVIDDQRTSGVSARPS